jgi:hypothetical protein
MGSNRGINAGKTAKHRYAFAFPWKLITYFYPLLPRDNRNIMIYEYWRQAACKKVKGSVYSPSSVPSASPIVPFVARVKVYFRLYG